MPDGRWRAGALRAGDCGARSTAWKVPFPQADAGIEQDLSRAPARMSARDLATEAVHPAAADVLFTGQLTEGWRAGRRFGQTGGRGEGRNPGRVPFPE